MHCLGGGQESPFLSLGSVAGKTESGFHIRHTIKLWHSFSYILCEPPYGFTFSKRRNKQTWSASEIAESEFQRAPTTKLIFLFLMVVRFPREDQKPPFPCPCVSTGNGKTLGGQVPLHPFPRHVYSYIIPGDLLAYLYMYTCVYSHTLLYTCVCAHTHIVFGRHRGRF